MVLFSVCLFTVLPKTSLVNKDFFNHLYSSHLTLPVYAFSSFLIPWGFLIEFMRNKGFILRQVGHFLLKRLAVFRPPHDGLASVFGPPLRFPKRGSLGLFVGPRVQLFVQDESQIDKENEICF